MADFGTWQDLPRAHVKMLLGLSSPSGHTNRYGTMLYRCQQVFVYMIWDRFQMLLLGGESGTNMEFSAMPLFFLKKTTMQQKNIWRNGERRHFAASENCGILFAKLNNCFLGETDNYMRLQLRLLCDISNRNNNNNNQSDSVPPHIQRGLSEVLEERIEHRSTSSSELGIAQCLSIVAMKLFSSASSGYLPPYTIRNSSWNCRTELNSNKGVVMATY